MVDYLNPFTEGIVLLASIGALVAVYFTLKLYEETKGDKYWAFFLVSTLAFGVHFWIDLPVDFHMISRDTGLIVGDASAIVGFISVAYAAGGLYSTMRRIRSRVK